MKTVLYLQIISICSTTHIELMCWKCSMHWFRTFEFWLFLLLDIVCIPTKIEFKWCTRECCLVKMLNVLQCSVHSQHLDGNLCMNMCALRSYFSWGIFICLGMFCVFWCRLRMSMDFHIVVIYLNAVSADVAGGSGGSAALKCINGCSFSVKIAHNRNLKLVQNRVCLFDAMCIAYPWNMFDVEFQ